MNIESKANDDYTEFAIGLSLLYMGLYLTNIILNI